MIYKLDNDALKALSTVFLKTLVEETNVLDSLENLELEQVEGKGDSVVGYLTITNPPTSVKFDNLPE